ncbi:MAG TPA: addiction module protein [Firmicutes bacterium]|nr:addiction module protein [Bacillota bacterium]
MTEQGKRVLAEALELSPIERAALVEELLSGFDFPERQEIDALWAKEAESRIEAYERGELHSSSAEAVFEGIEGR